MFALSSLFINNYTISHFCQCDSRGSTCHYLFFVWIIEIASFFYFFNIVSTLDSWNLFSTQQPTSIRPFLSSKFCNVPHSTENERLPLHLVVISHTSSFLTPSSQQGPLLLRFKPSSQPPP
jgi:hypothetical protein